MSLLVKWWWRYNKEDGLWKKVIKSIHESGQNNELIPVRSSIGGIWKAIGGVKKVIHDFGIDPSTKINWVENRGWSWEDKGEYLSRYVREEIDSHLNVNGTEIVKWNNWVPKKVNVMIWRAAQNRLPALKELEKRGVIIDSTICGECGDEEESVEHALLGCAKVMDLWSKIGQWCRLSTFFAFSLPDLFSLHESMHGSSTWKRLIGSIVMITAWCLWRARNKRIHEGVRWEVADLVEEIKVLSRLWIANRTSKVDKDWSKWSTFHMI